MTQLVIHVPSIEDAPRRFELRADAAWLREQALPEEAGSETLLEPLVLDLEAYRVGRRLLFKGELRGRVRLLCGRCTEPFEHAFAEPVSLLLEPAPASATLDAGLELDPEDLELGRYAGDELDFAPVLVETLLTSWPMQPRCSEGCRGLCPACGANLNRAPCGCEDRAGGRPFESLRELLDRGRDTTKTRTD